MSISDWSSDVCSSDLVSAADAAGRGIERALARAVLSGKLGFEDLKRLALSVMNDIARSAISGGIGALFGGGGGLVRSEEHTSELQSLMRISYAVFCLKKKKKRTNKELNKYYKQ